MHADRQVSDVRRASVNMLSVKLLAVHADIQFSDVVDMLQVNTLSREAVHCEC